MRNNSGLPIFWNVSVSAQEFKGKQQRPVPSIHEHSMYDAEGILPHHKRRHRFSPYFSQRLDSLGTTARVNRHSNGMSRVNRFCSTQEYGLALRGPVFATSEDMRFGGKECMRKHSGT